MSVQGLNRTDGLSIGPIPGSYGICLDLNPYEYGFRSRVWDVGCTPACKRCSLAYRLACSVARQSKLVCGPARQPAEVMPAQGAGVQKSPRILGTRPRPPPPRPLQRHGIVIGPPRKSPEDPRPSRAPSWTPEHRRSPRNNPGAHLAPPGLLRQPWRHFGASHQPTEHSRAPRSPWNDPEAHLAQDPSDNLGDAPEDPNSALSTPERPAAF
ncbi:hypothetical protein PGT21_015933 [Puccinia graminis f. sp. tritici]|uniref:Uncharacterized protein n=1 Tax=Puccinia graminis f. sp. tritici TaxID=56615 RepID=A0A5B0R0R1_PUCGR|nr:hypothetical protein PGT21_015933 [Puccinia graminis f. sp. tritici]